MTLIAWNMVNNVRRSFWQYRRFWAAVSLVLTFLAVRFFLPSLPMFRGWEQKFTYAALDISKQEIPPDAARIGSFHELEGVFHDSVPFDPQIAEIHGPIMVAAWPCVIVKKKSACIRYIWQGSQMTLVVTEKPEKIKNKHAPFAKAGEAGYLVIDGRSSAALVGPFTPEELKAAWPYAARFAN